MFYVLTLQNADVGWRCGLRVRFPHSLGRELHLSEHRPGFHRGEGELPPVRSHLVDPYPPFLEHEKSLASALRCVEYLPLLDVRVRNAPGELLQFIFRKGLENVNQGKKPNL